MRAIVDDRARLQRMLDFEAALARAEAALAVVPASAVEPIVAACRAERYDAAAIGAAAVPAGNVAIPVVDALTAEVAKTNADAARYVHWGATSQDLIDTAQVLEMRAGIDALLGDLDKTINGFTALAGKHRRTAAVGRTWLQHALPIPFGLKLAGYAAALARSRERLRRLRKEALVLQFGGAVGTLAALGEHGLAVSERLAALLDLPIPEAPWHGHGDRLAEVAAALAILTGTCGKIARDVALLMQTEVQEVSEPAGPGRGVSSTMPHKRNPTAAAMALSAATIAPNLLATLMAGLVQEHERGLGGWQAQWPTYPALLLATSGALAAVADLAQGLEINAERMRENLDLTRGLIMAEAVAMALGAKIGRQEAHAVVDEASRKAVDTKRDLQSVLSEDPRVTSRLTPGELASLFELLRYQGVAQTFIDRTVGAVQGRSLKRP